MGVYSSLLKTGSDREEKEKEKEKGQTQRPTGALIKSLTIIKFPRYGVPF